MPFLLIFPIVGIAAIAVLVVRGHSKSASAHAEGPTGATTQHFELDQGMPEPLVHQVLTALMHGQEPAQLEALARELGTKYPLAAAELNAKVTAVHAAGSQAAASSPTAGEAPATPASPDMGQAALILQGAMRALTQETDPVELEGFGESIRATYPTAAVLLVGRARELRAAAAAAPNVVSLAIPPLSSLPPAAPPPASRPATYIVQAGDTPAVIAEKLAHDSKRWPELVAANPSKPTGADGNFASLRGGETLHIPPAWGAPATMAMQHASGLSHEARP